MGGYKLPFADVVDGKLCAVWGGVSGAAGALAGARTEVAIPDAERAAVVAHVARYYEAFDKPLPDALKAFNPSTTDAEREELRFNDDLTAASKRFEAARNIVRHWVKGGRALSPDALDLLLSPMGMIPEILRAGRVLSDQNRTACMTARDALTDVLQRDDESRGRTVDESGDVPAEPVKAVADILGAAYRVPLLRQPYNHTSQ
jgi:hypothetical protein